MTVIQFRRRAHEIGRCDTCNKPIYQGDLHAPTAAAEMFCMEHAYTLVDARDQYRDILAKDDQSSMDALCLSREELEIELARLEYEIATYGNRQVLVRA